MLPLDIQMQIDLTAQAHKREIADGFARLRARLLPPPPKRTSLQAMLGMAPDRYFAAAQMNAALNQNPLVGGQHTQPYGDPLWSLIGGAGSAAIGLWRA